MVGLSIRRLILLTAVSVVFTSLVVSYVASTAFFEALVDADARRQVTQLRGDINRSVGTFIVYHETGVENARSTKNMRELGVAGVLDSTGKLVYGSWAEADQWEASSSDAVLSRRDDGIYAVVPVTLASYESPLVDYERRVFSNRTDVIHRETEALGTALVRLVIPASAATDIRRRHLVISSILVSGVLFVFAILVYRQIGRPLAIVRDRIEHGEIEPLRRLAEKEFSRVQEIGSLIDAYLERYDLAQANVSRLEAMVEERTEKLHGIAARNRVLMLRATHEVDREPKRIAAEIHDDLCSIQVALKRRMEQYRRKLQRNPGAISAAEIDDALATWLALTDEVDTVARAIIGRYRNDTIQYLGIEAALKDTVNRECAESTSIKRIVVINRSRTLESLKQSTEREIIGVVKEAVRNVVRHTVATRVSVTVDDIEEMLVFQVSDNGGGFDIAKQGESFGLDIMEERAAYLGGSFDVQRSGAGTLLIFKVPFIGQTHAASSINVLFDRA